MASQINPPRGMRDFLPTEKTVRNDLLSKIVGTYASHGFQEIETPALEAIERLSSGDGGDNEKLAFRVLKRGEELEAALVAHCLDDSPEDFALHGLPTHEIDILAAAVVVDVVEAVRVGEPSLEHVEAPALAVHEVNEFLCIEFNALVIFSEVNTSNL